MSIACPGCGTPAEELRLEGHYGRTVAIDVCRSCRGLWLDGLELLQLAPGAILSLLKTMDDPQAERRPLGDRMACPRCQLRLLPTDDRQRATTFHYFRCPAGHGRFMTFFQFLRSRNFVRELTEAELANLRQHIQSINCSNCGAPVEVARASTCAYCHTPISTVEPGQIRATIEELERADARRKTVDAFLPLKMIEARAETERAFRQAGDPDAVQDAVFQLLNERPGEGIVEAGLRALLRHLGR